MLKGGRRGHFFWRYGRLLKYQKRDAVREDLADIVSIYNSTIASRMVTADTEPVSVEDREAWFSRHSSNFRPLWVIEHNKEICAWVSFESFYGRPAYNKTAEVSIYIHQNYRGKGLGKWMLQQVVDACPVLDIKTLLGFIFGHNQPSLNLFYHFGFEKWAELPNVAELDSIERDLIIMGKRVIE